MHQYYRQAHIYPEDYFPAPRHAPFSNALHASADTYAPYGAQGPIPSSQPHFRSVPISGPDERLRFLSELAELRWHQQQQFAIEQREQQQQLWEQQQQYQEHYQEQQQHEQPRGQRRRHTPDFSEELDQGRGRKIPRNDPTTTPSSEGIAPPPRYPMPRQYFVDRSTPSSHQSGNLAALIPVIDDSTPSAPEKPDDQQSNKRLSWFAREPSQEKLVIDVHKQIKSALELRKRELEAGKSINHNKCQFVYDTNPKLFEEFGIVDPKVIGARLRDLAYGRSTDRSGTLTQELTQDLYFYAGPASKRVAAAKQQQLLQQQQQQQQNESSQSKSPLLEEEEQHSHPIEVGTSPAGTG